MTGFRPLLAECTAGPLRELLRSSCFKPLVCPMTSFGVHLMAMTMQESCLNGTLALGYGYYSFKMSMTSFGSQCQPVVPLGAFNYTLDGGLTAAGPASIFVGDESTSFN